MRILVSAYACEPYKGSEPNVGWERVLAYLSLGHSVSVITRANNKANIETWLAKNPKSELKMIYYDCSPLIKRIKKRNQGVHLYYFLWQLGIFAIAFREVRSCHYDFIHHVTFVSVRQPSFLGWLGIPFVFGPVAGGEAPPYFVRRSFPFKGWLRDFFRDFANSIVRFEPFLLSTFYSANKIYVTSDQTKKLLPKWVQQKCQVQLAIGSSDLEVPVVKVSTARNNVLKLLFVGNLLYLKGVHLAIQALERYIRKNPCSGVTLTIIGSGPDKKWLESFVTSSNLKEKILWVEAIPQLQVFDYYISHDALIFPSLRDSGGLVVLEALSFGMPVICIDIGGPGQIIDETCGIKIPVFDSSEDTIIDRLASSIDMFEKKANLSEYYAVQCRSKARQFSWVSQSEKFVQDMTSDHLGI